MITIIIIQQNNPQPKDIYNITYWGPWGLQAKYKVPDYLIKDGYYWGPSGPKAIMKIVNCKAEKMPNSS